MSGRHVALLSLILAASLAIPGRLQAQETTGAAVEGDIVTAPVELDGLVLFRVRGVTAFPAQVRARQIRDRIAAVAADPTVSIDSLRIVDSEGVSRILADGQTILGVIEADASLEQVSRADIAGVYLTRVRDAIAAYRMARTASALRRAAVNTLLATLLLAITIGALLWVWRRLDALLTRRLQAHIRTVGIQSFELMRADRIWAAMRSGFLGLRTVLLLASALVYVGYVLAQWP